MQRRTLLLSAAALGAGAADAEPASALQVVASFSILADMVREVGGPAVSVKSLVPTDGDAHTYQPRPSDLRSLQAAGLVVMNGLGMEGWMDRLLPSAGITGPVVIASAGVTARRMGEGTDPHAWQDPANGVLYANNIAAGLAKADPAKAEFYRARAQDYTGQITQAGTWIDRQLAGVPKAKRKILTSHDAFFYFGARYHIEFHGIEGLDTETEPSAGQIATLIRLIKAENIKAVFVENMTSPRLAQMIARETGAVLGPTVYSDALSPPQGPASTYLKMFNHNVPLFARAMQAN
jgi:zinc/manganese transport system substrate-binding protein